MVANVKLIRPGTLNDVGALAELVNFAGQGLPLYLWKKLASAGEDPWSVGRARAAREEGSFSYKNAIVIDGDNGIAACLIGYSLPEESKAIDETKMPAIFVPLQQLENLAPGTWYVNVLATYHEWRRKGFGTALLRYAEKLAFAAETRKGMSVIVADNNISARRLYEHMGYQMVADRCMVKEEWDGAGSSWVLLTKGA